MKKLLIIDDEPGVRALVRMTLDVTWVEILEAADGEEGIAMAREHRPDIVLLDVMMPNLNGFDVCKALKSDPDLRATTIVMLTARAQDADVTRGLAAGADDYFTKPFSPLALMAKVEDVLGPGSVQ